jgi:hypothetical protein
MIIVVVVVVAAAAAAEAMVVVVVSLIIKVMIKGRVNPINCHEGTERGVKCNCIISLT